MERALSVLVVVAAFAAYQYLMFVVNFPFNYIYQSKYAVCSALNNTFCTRIQYAVAALVIYSITVRFLAVKNEVLDFNPTRLSQGAMLGGGVAAAAYCINLALGFTRFKSWVGVNVSNLATQFAGMSMTGFTEELLYRGLLVGVAQNYANPYLCVVVSALYFGYVHLQYSVMYGLSAFGAGLLLGLGYLSYGLYWCVGFHSLFNFLETGLYTLTRVKVLNALMGGARKTPDDDGLTTPLLEMGIIGLYISKFI